MAAVYAPVPQTLASLAPEYNAPGVTPLVASVPVVKETSNPWTGAWGIISFIIWFIVLAIIIGLIIWAVKPAWAMKPSTGPGTSLDAGKIIGAAVIISLIICLIIWVISALVRGGKK